MRNGRHSKISRIASATIVVVVLAMVFAGLAKTFAYFKIGADNGEIYVINTNILKDHHPKVIWQADQIVDGRIVNDYMRSELEKAYKEAWYVANMSIANKDDGHLEDYFAGKALVWIKAEVNDSSEYTVHQTELNHDLQLNHFTLDNQLAAFSDNGVKVVRKVLDSDREIIYEEESTFDYEVVMTLDDGRWRIRHLVKKIKQENIRSDSLARDTNRVVKLESMKGVNYYPASTPWFDFWENYSKDTTEQDLNIARSLGFNTVRIFLQYSVFGEEDVKKEMLNKLGSFLDIAQNKQINVIVTLFDFPRSYDLINYTSTDRHLESILTKFKDNEAILAWDIKNEPDLDFKIYGEQVVNDWLAFVIARAREYDPNHLITIGWSDAKDAHNLSDRVDFVSFHFYKKAENLSSTIKALKHKCADKKLVLGEFGQTSLKSALTLYSKSEEKQQDYYEEVFKVLEEEKVSYVCWALHDFKDAPTEVFGLKPWIRGPQKHFGLLRNDGTQKPVASLIKK